jgi:hypothetical protein
MANLDQDRLFKGSAGLIQLLEINTCQPLILQSSPGLPTSPRRMQSLHLAQVREVDRAVPCSMLNLDGEAA